MSTCFSTCRSTSAGHRLQAARAAARPGARSVSRSSPKILSDDLRPHARQHVVEAVRDRLADGDRRPAARRAWRGCRRRPPPCCASSARGRRRSRCCGRPRRARRARRGRCAGRRVFTSGTSHEQPLGDRARAGCDSASEMPGLYCRLTSSVPSLNGGRNARGSRQRADAGRHARRARRWRTEARGRRNAHCSSLALPRLELRTTKLSPLAVA